MCYIAVIAIVINFVDHCRQHSLPFLFLNLSCFCVIKMKHLCRLPHDQTHNEAHYYFKSSDALEFISFRLLYFDLS